jgi:quercetin dioxygenase-like cupin family protein
LNFSLHEHPGGVDTGAGSRVVYDVARNQAHFGAARVDGHALVWEIGGEGVGAVLSREVELDPETAWLARCDRIDFPPGGVAYTHTHPGPGIRYLLTGGIEIQSEGETGPYRPGEAWFESGPNPVYAAASATEETAFVRVLLLPVVWEGKRTIHYVDPADEAKPKLQRPTVFFDRRLEL